MAEMSQPENSIFLKLHDNRNSTNCKDQLQQSTKHLQEGDKQVIGIDEDGQSLLLYPPNSLQQNQVFNQCAQKYDKIFGPDEPSEEMMEQLLNQFGNRSDGITQVISFGNIFDDYGNFYEENFQVLTSCISKAKNAGYDNIVCSAFYIFDDKIYDFLQSQNQKNQSRDLKFKIQKQSNVISVAGLEQINVEQYEIDEVFSMMKDSFFRYCNQGVNFCSSLFFDVKVSNFEQQSRIIRFLFLPFYGEKIYLKFQNTNQILSYKKSLESLQYSLLRLKEVVEKNQNSQFQKQIQVNIYSVNDSKLTYVLKNILQGEQKFIFLGQISCKNSNFENSCQILKWIQQSFYSNYNEVSNSCFNEVSSGTISEVSNQKIFEGQSQILQTPKKKIRPDFSLGFRSVQCSSKTKFTDEKNFKKNSSQFLSPRKFHEPSNSVKFLHRKLQQHSPSSKKSADFECIADNYSKNSKAQKQDNKLIQNQNNCNYSPGGSADISEVFNLGNKLFSQEYSRKSDKNLSQRTFLKSQNHQHAQQQNNSKKKIQKNKYFKSNLQQKILLQSNIHEKQNQQNKQKIDEFQLNPKNAKNLEEEDSKSTSKGNSEKQQIPEIFSSQINNKVIIQINNYQKSQNNDSQNLNLNLDLNPQNSGPTQILKNEPQILDDEKSFQDSNSYDFSEMQQFNQNNNKKKLVQKFSQDDIQQSVEFRKNSNISYDINNYKENQSQYKINKNNNNLNKNNVSNSRSINNINNENQSRIDINIENNNNNNSNFIKNKNSNSRSINDGDHQYQFSNNNCCVKNNLQSISCNQQSFGNIVGLDEDMYIDIIQNLHEKYQQQLDLNYNYRQEIYSLKSLIAAMEYQHFDDKQSENSWKLIQSNSEEKQEKK